MRLLFLLSLSTLLFFSCKKENETPQSDSENTQVDDWQNLTSESYDITDFEISDTAGFKGDTIFVKDLKGAWGISGPHYAKMANGDEFEIIKIADDVYGFVIPETTSGKLSIAHSIHAHKSGWLEFDFYYKELSCDLINQLEVSNFTITSINNNGVSYSFDLKNTSSSYLDLYRNVDGKITHDAGLQNYVSDTETGSKSPAGGSIITGVGSIIAPGETVKVNYSSYSDGNYLHVYLTGYFQSTGECSDRLIYSGQPKP